MKAVGGGGGVEGAYMIVCRISYESRVTKEIHVLRFLLLVQQTV